MGSIGFYKSHFVISNNVAQYTYSFQLKVDFIGLLKLIDVLEHDKLGEFISGATSIEIYNKTTQMFAF